MSTPQNILSQIKDTLRLCTQHRQMKTLSASVDVTSTYPEGEEEVTFAISYYSIERWIGDVMSHSDTLRYQMYFILAARYCIRIMHLYSHIYPTSYIHGTASFQIVPPKS